MDYSDFRIKALELYSKLDEERNELYKRHFIKFAIEDSISGKDVGESEQNLSNKITELLKIKFDVLVSNNTAQSNSKYVRIYDTKTIPKDFFGKKLLKSEDDKHLAFLHASTKRIVEINIPEGVDAKINIFYSSKNAPLVTQTLINAGKKSKLKLLLWNGSKAQEPSLSANCIEFSLDKSSRVDASVIHNQDEKTKALQFINGVIGEDAALHANFVYSGAIQTKSRGEFIANEFKAGAFINEIIIGAKTQKYDVYTKITNNYEKTIATLESRAALMDSSFCILKGFAKINKYAKWSNSYVNEKGILLDNEAKIESMPDLSIEEADVKATHSSSTEPLNQEHLFYLMSRGLDENEAKKLLVRSLFGALIAKIDDSIAKNIILSIINSKLENKGIGEAPKLDLSGIWLQSNQENEIFKGHYKYN